MTLSIMGLYNYDPTVLDGLVKNLPKSKLIPSNIPTIQVFDFDPEIIVENLLIECAELEFMYPMPSQAKLAIRAWAEVRKYNWQQLYNTMFYAYNPIWNKDGSIVRTETETRDLIRTDTIRESEKSEFNGGNVRNPDTTRTTKMQSSAFNTNTLVDRETTTENLEGTDTETSNGASSGSNNGDNKSTDKGTVKRVYEDKEQGNIGVTMTQDMIQAQREIVTFNVCDFIVEDFKNRFCLEVY